jgi:small subunit ribosomal protein S18
MAKKQKRRKKIIPVKPISTKCRFCESKKDPSFKDYKTLGKYVSERGRMAGRERSGNCAKHQRQMAVEIKRARHLGLLPF